MFGCLGVPYGRVFSFKIKFTQRNDCENYEQRGVCLTCMEDAADFKRAMACGLHKMHVGEDMLTDNITGFFFPVEILHGRMS